MPTPRRGKQYPIDKTEYDPKRLSRLIKEVHRETFLDGLRVSLVMAALLLLATTAASLLLRPRSSGELAGAVRHRGTRMRRMTDYLTHDQGDAPMTAWTSDELTKIATAEELKLAPLRRDGTLRTPVTIWVVRHGDGLYVRSFKGRTAAWFRGTQVRHEGRIWAGGVEKDVIFVDADPTLNNEIDAAYRTKYRRYGARFVNPMVGPEARAATIKLVPRATSS